MNKPGFTSYPVEDRNERERLIDNRHLQRLAESIQVNTGEPSRDVKESEQVGTKEPMNPPRPKKEVRVVIVCAWQQAFQVG
jgi:hypothetical protein